MSNARGLFGPGSATWMVDREMALALGGPRALHLQIAHPAVAAAVEKHSDFRSDPLGRLQRTLESVFTIVFGDRADATATAARVTRRHAPIRGVIDEPSGSPWSGRAYHALDPELLLWVHATLVDTSLHVFRTLIRPLEPDEAARYYDESRVVGELLGIPRTVIPPTLSAFHDYFDRMIEGPILHVGAAARTQSGELARFNPSDSFASIYGRAWGQKWSKHIDRPSVKRAFSWSSHLLAAGMLPASLREAYGLRWTRRDRAAYQALTSVVRVSYRALPESLRFLPGYREAVLRAERGDAEVDSRSVRTDAGAAR
jgi:uncharacterized protein (DUF2236 family)